LKDVEAIQKRRDQLEKDLTTRRDSLVQGRHDLTSEISSSGYKLFLSGDIEKFTSLIDSLRQRGELPAGIKKQFVNDLLNHKLCICRRAIEEGSAARQAVEEWMMKAGLADVEEKAIRMGGELSTLSHSISQVLERIDNIQRKRELDRREISSIEDELDDIKRKLIGSRLRKLANKSLIEQMRLDLLINNP
jgi:DNA sulfur modification protein DndD